MHVFGLEILFIFVLLVVNGLFSMPEIAVVSSRRGRLKKQSDDGERRARTAFEPAENPNRFLSTVQIGITLAGFVSTRMERLPKIGDKFERENYTIEVVDMDGRLVDEVLVAPVRQNNQN